jgi:molybdopterin-containing oxidoreductase family membrane subunit
MAILFVIADVGGPLKLWHMIPVIGFMNFPNSLLAWDSIVLSLYFFLNLFIVIYILYKHFNKQDYNKKFLNPLILISIPLAVSIHSVTAFLFNGLAARPYWNSALLAPKFIASALCSGPAILLILFQILKKTTEFEIKKEAIWKIAELMAYSMALYLFLFFSEIFKEIYSDTEHLVYLKHLFFGFNGHNDLVVYAWVSIIFSIIAFVLFLIPKTRKNVFTLNLGAILIYIGVYIEKGIALIIPGFSPDVLGQLYSYKPSIVELKTSVMIFSIGFLIFTLMTKVAVEILFKNFNYERLINKK